MLLAIEQGNTNTLFAVHDGSTWIAQWRAATEATRTADEYAVWLSQLLNMAGLGLGILDGCIISSVVPQSMKIVSSGRIWRAAWMQASRLADAWLSAAVASS